ncbi:MAG: TonB-dependent receptor plug domain-containing protein [Bacteroidota bacterium]
MKSSLKNIAISIGVVLIIFSCASTDQSASSKSQKKGNTVKVDQAHLDLPAYLRRVPGVMINGDEVLIRSTTSAAGATQPLFVLDGVVIGNSLARANELVVVNDIKNVRVIKAGADAAMYGTQGSNGVIVITTKKKASD